jgi:hypothetical protein
MEIQRHKHEKMTIFGRIFTVFAKLDCMVMCQQNTTNADTNVMNTQTHHVEQLSRTASTPRRSFSVKTVFVSFVRRATWMQPEAADLDSPTSIAFNINLRRFVCIWFMLQKYPKHSKSNIRKMQVAS